MNAIGYNRIGRKGVAAGAMLLTGALLGYTAAPDAKSTSTGQTAVAARFDLEAQFRVMRPFGFKTLAAVIHARSHYQLPVIKRYFSYCHAIMSRLRHVPFRMWVCGVKTLPRPRPIR